MSDFPTTGLVINVSTHEVGGVEFVYRGANNWDEVQKGYATFTDAGLVLKATQAEIDAGTDDLKYATPAYLRDMGGATLDSTRQKLGYGYGQAISLQDNSLSAPSNALGANGDFAVVGDNAGTDKAYFQKRGGVWVEVPQGAFAERNLGLTYGNPGSVYTINNANNQGDIRVRANGGWHVPSSLPGWSAPSSTIAMTPPSHSGSVPHTNVSVPIINEYSYIFGLHGAFGSADNGGGTLTATGGPAIGFGHGQSTGSIVKGLILITTDSIGVHGGIIYYNSVGVGKTLTSSYNGNSITGFTAQPSPGSAFYLLAYGPTPLA